MKKCRSSFSVLGSPFSIPRFSCHRRFSYLPRTLSHLPGGYVILEPSVPDLACVFPETIMPVPAVDNLLDTLRQMQLVASSRLDELAREAGQFAETRTL